MIENEPQVESWESGVRSQRSGVRSQRSGVRSQKGSGSFLFEVFLHPQIQQSLGGDAALAGRGPNLLRQRGLDRIVSTFGLNIDFEFHRPGFVPVVGEVVRIPELGALVIRACLRNGGLISWHTVYVPTPSCPERTVSMPALSFVYEKHNQVSPRIYRPERPVHILPQEMTPFQQNE